MKWVPIEQSSIHSSVYNLFCVSTWYNWNYLKTIFYRTIDYTKQLLLVYMCSHCITKTDSEEISIYVNKGIGHVFAWKLMLGSIESTSNRLQMKLFYFIQLDKKHVYIEQSTIPSRYYSSICVYMVSPKQVQVKYRTL